MVDGQLRHKRGGEGIEKATGIETVIMVLFRAMTALL